jgi:diaminohydroxyphosphoribosylaminopyrimidine deaminase / 5-amino-6-(5-phosphoribosylamino)uracil reductase
MTDEEFMRYALEISLKGSPNPNPHVGAVIVKDEKIIGEGYHKKAGMPHAEVEALTGVNAKDATLYVILEPCSHYGRTPPCTDTIIKAGIKKVVYGMEDPTEKVRGREILEAAGVQVKAGVLKRECKMVNEAFIKHSKTGLPFVSIKAAMSADGFIAAKNGKSQWITSEASRDFAHNLRRTSNAILVGVNTVIEDNPRLNCRRCDGKDPLRVILDSKLRIPKDSRVLDDNNVLIATTKKAPGKTRKELEKKARIWDFEGDKPCLKELLKRLGAEGITSVLVEGGSKVNMEFLRLNLIDKYYFIIAPKIFGAGNISAFHGEGINDPNESGKIVFDEVKRLGEDILVTAYPRSYNKP